MADEFCLKMPDFHVTFRDLLHAVNLRHGTNGFTSFPKEFALKNPTASAGFEPANLGTKGQHATSRPPKPLKSSVRDRKQPVGQRFTLNRRCSPPITMTAVVICYYTPNIRDHFIHFRGFLRIILGFFYSFDCGITW